MKTTLYVLASLVALLTGLASLEVTGILPFLGEFLPEPAVKTVAVAPTLAAVLAHAFQAIKNHLEEIAKPSLNLLLLLLAVIIFFPSCAGITAGLTGQPIHTTPVQRADGEGVPFELATSDLVRAETQPGRKWGLYDAGAVAIQTADVVASGK